MAKKLARWVVMVSYGGVGTNLMSQATGGKASARRGREPATADGWVGEGESSRWRIENGFAGVEMKAGGMAGGSAKEDRREAR